MDDHYRQASGIDLPFGQHATKSKDPVKDTLFDPLVITDDSGARTATNIFKTYTAKLTGKGDALDLELRAVQDVGAESLKH